MDVSPETVSFILFSPSQWTASWVAAIATVVSAIAAVMVAVWPHWQSFRNRRALEKDAGGQLFGKEIIHNATRYYVPPDCSSVDPSQEAEIRQVIVTKDPLLQQVDEYLAEGSPNRHLLLLADSGMGKSAFVLNYYAHNQRRWKQNRQRIALVPLSIQEADEQIAKIPDKSNTVLFLDAFDEDAKAITGHRQRLLDLMQACRDFKRVLITCRTPFFLSDEEIPKETGIVRIGPRKGGEGREYEFWKLYLSPLSNKQVQMFLRRRYPYWPWGSRRKAWQIVDKIPLLTVRPMLLTNIPDLLEGETEIIYSFQLYDIMVEKWLEREKSWTQNTEALRSFSEQLAVDLYIRRQQRGTEQIPPTELATLAAQWQIPLVDWQLRGRSLLNRDAAGNCKFAHRSIMEYLVVKRLAAGDEACQELALTDQMQKFAGEIVSRNVKQLQEENGVPPAAFLREAHLEGFGLAEANLVGVDLRSALLRDTNLEGANLQDAHLVECRSARCPSGESEPEGYEPGEGESEGCEPEEGESGGRPPERHESGGHEPARRSPGEIRPKGHGPGGSKPGGRRPTRRLFRECSLARR